MKSFFNLPQATLDGRGEKPFFDVPQKHSVETHWKTFEEQGMNKQSLFDIFAGTIPVIRQKDFLSQDEWQKMVELLKSHDMGMYDPNHVWPRVGCVGIAQTDHVNDKEAYFSRVKEAHSLQNRWKDVLGIDIVGRIIKTLENASGMAVRRAREGEREYFVGMARAIETGIQIHADHAPFEGNGWEIGRVAAQLTWNILLSPVPGGDTVVYDRQWQAPQDDLAWRKDFPKYAYDPRVVDGHALKVVKPTPGDLYWFNPRNFHEIRPCDMQGNGQSVPTRYTISSFVGFLPAQRGEPDTIILWS